MNLVNCTLLNKSDKEGLEHLFRSVFTSSEGEEEGKRIGQLASNLAAKIDNEEVICFGACEEEVLIGSIFFTRLRFDVSIRVYLLAPVAVSNEHQGKGVGQALIKSALSDLRNRGVAAVVTYGDLSFYSKTGFHRISESVIQAPVALSMPEGWLAQSLTDEPVPIISKRPACVQEFHDPVYW
ncbi:MAG: N-acetyltransferase [Pseudomonadota bacterium]